jgi:hypothetical protein
MEEAAAEPVVMHPGLVGDVDSIRGCGVARSLGMNTERRVKLLAHASVEGFLVPICQPELLGQLRQVFSVPRLGDQGRAG